MSKIQRQIGVGGAAVFVLLLLFPPWRIDYDGGASLIAYSLVFSPPNDYRHIDGNRSIPPQATSIAAWTLLGELVATGGVVAFLLWIYRPSGTAPVSTIPPVLGTTEADQPRT
jgi:hypothetical protein